MILATRYAGDREVRAQFGDSSIPSWYSTGRGLSVAGQRVTVESASGLTAVGRAIRLPAGLIASLRLLVFEGRRGERQERPESRQAELLERPCLGMSSFDWLWDIVSSLEASENAYLQKGRDKQGRVVQLYPLPLGAVNGSVLRGRKVFEIHTASGWQTIDENEILHIRGQTVGGGAFGVSRIHQHRDPLGAMLAAQKFEGAHFRNHARPNVAILFPQGVTQEQAAVWKPEWEAKYGGVDNAGQAIPLGGGADIKPIPINMRDAQFIEAKQHGVEDVGRIMDMDPVLLGVEADGDSRRAALDLFLRLQLPPRLRRLEEAFRGDPDLFGMADRMYPQFEIDDLMFADALRRAQVQHFRIQDGTELVDEARADNGRGPLPPLPKDPSQTPGQIPQITPVGGAPNEFPVSTPDVPVEE